MTERRLWRERVEAQLELCKAEIARIEAKTKIGRVEADAAIQKYLAELRDHRDKVAAKLDELRAESGEAMSDVGHGFEAAWHELTEAFKRARAKFEE